MKSKHGIGICRKRWNRRRLLAVVIAACFVTPLIPLWGQSNLVEASPPPESGKLEGDVELDTDFIWSVTYDLSQYIFAYPPRGRCFGTPGEQWAAQNISERMNNIFGSQNVHTEDIDAYWPVVGDLAHGWLNERDVPQEWYLNVTVLYTPRKETTSKATISRNMTCFPLMDSTPNIHNYVEGEIVDEYQCNKIWLIEEDWMHPYKCIDDITLGQWLGMKAFILMDCFDDTRFMFPSGGLQPPFGMSINRSDGNWIKGYLNNSDYTVTAKIYEKHYYDYYIDSVNVIGEISGSDNSKVVIIGTHYDSWWCQGASDNGVGVATMLGIAKYFTDNQITPEYKLKFVAFGGEEWYQRGSKDYVKHHCWWPGSENVIYMINLDMFADQNPEFPLNLTASNQTLADLAYDIATNLDYTQRTDYSLKRDWPVHPATDGGIFQNYSWSDPGVIGPERYPSKLYHRDGNNHEKGDVITLIDQNDLNVTAQVALAIAINLTVDDAIPPDSSVDQIIPYWQNSPIAINVTASDTTSGVCKVELWYRYSPDNSSWGGWTRWSDTLYRTPWSWEFNFPNGEGYYQFYSMATDYHGNEQNYAVLVECGYDTTPPEIANGQETEYFDSAICLWTVNISAAVKDNIEVDQVYLNITYPDDSQENFSITENKTGDTYYCNKTYGAVGEKAGICNYLIWAIDTTGNQNISAGHQFWIPPDWDVNGDREVNVLDMTIVGQHWGETGPPGWIRADVNRDGVINVLDMIIIGQHWGPYSSNTASIDIESTSDSTVALANVSITRKKLIVNVIIDPSEPIAGVQFDLSFDPSLITVENITEGDLFDERNTYFINGTIDNTNGTITGVCSIVLGRGGTMSSGTIATITLTVKEQNRIHPQTLCLSNVIVGSPDGKALQVMIK